ncbi:uncharacterized protein VP01_4275g1 [Puccinia sorghi]|uniref:GAG-pre-integrase domain-containing protein n=1 Tax=Puccinia sorghi TaxID=27349 RepID=A0A0L6US84_9BASI|nr:uncharacterized protein VP01_4275g1 [Puccinia sorghi]
MHESSKMKKKGRRGPYCAPGKHNPEAKIHNAKHCWQLHKQRPHSSKPQMRFNQPTTQLVEADDRHESESNIKISTGGHSNFLNATAVGSEILINHRCKKLILENALLVPSLTQSLISIPQLFKHKIYITKTADKGAFVLTDKGFHLNNLLELHSSYFEAMKPQSVCYQSSPETINWHAQIGHPNQRYQQLMVPNSEIIDCSVCKTCKLKSLPVSVRTIKRI